MATIPSPIKLEPLPEGERLTPLHLAAVRPDGLSFMWCVRSAIETPGFVAQFDRLRGCNLTGKGLSPISRLVDEATGRADDDMAKFLAFVWDVVFLPGAGRPAYLLA